MNSIGKIDQEKQTVELMIRMYCKKKEHNNELCAQCEELIKYAQARLDRCPDGDNKGLCKHCPRHCYNSDMRAKIRTVMRFSGPRMLLYSPLAVIKHLLK